MQAFEMRERAPSPQNFVAKGLKRVGEVFGRAPKPTEPVMEFHEIPGDPVAKIVFGEAGVQASIHMIAAMAQVDNPQRRLEDNFILVISSIFIIR